MKWNIDIMQVTMQSLRVTVKVMIESLFLNSSEPHWAIGFLLDGAWDAISIVGSQKEILLSKIPRNICNSVNSKPLWSFSHFEEPARIRYTNLKFWPAKWAPSSQLRPNCNYGPLYPIGELLCHPQRYTEAHLATDVYEPFPSGLLIDTSPFLNVVVISKSVRAEDSYHKKQKRHTPWDSSNSLL